MTKIQKIASAQKKCATERRPVATKVVQRKTERKTQRTQAELEAFRNLVSHIRSKRSRFTWLIRKNSGDKRKNKAYRSERSKLSWQIRRLKSAIKEGGSLK